MEKNLVSLFEPEMLSRFVFFAFLKIESILSSFANGHHLRLHSQLNRYPCLYRITKMTRIHFLRHKSIHHLLEYYFSLFFFPPIFFSPF